MGGFHNYSLEKQAIPITQVLLSLEQMSTRGFTADEILSGTGINTEDFQGRDNRVSYRQRIRQLENIQALMNDPGYWLDAHRIVSISDYGLLGYAMMSSATLEQAIEIAVKYHRTAGAMFDLTFRAEDSQAILRVDHLLPAGMVAQMVVEELFLSVTPLISLLLGNSHRPHRICLAYQEPAFSARYANAFQCPVQFDSEFNEYRFEVAELRLPLAEADSNTARICEESCRSLLNQMEIEEDIVSRICHQLLRTPGEFPRLDVVADRLSIGARTLRRRLRALGTSYQNILDDVKKELAIEYLQTTNLSIQEISELLGYTEVTNFRRAFVKWVSLSPHQYRQQMA